MMTRLLELIYPPRCMLCDQLLPFQGERWLCHHCKPLVEPLTEFTCIKCGRPVENEGKECIRCTKEEMFFKRNFAVFVYDDVVSAMIRSMKYHKRPRNAEGFARWMTDYFQAQIPVSVDYLAPIPMYRKKEGKRGFNQAKLICMALAKGLGIPYLPDLLIRKRDTKPQNRLNPTARKQNLVNAFECNPKYQIRTKNIMLIDDIYTTGSTLNACSMVLMEKGAKNIYGFCTAVVPKGKKLQ